MVVGRSIGPTGSFLLHRRTQSVHRGALGSGWGTELCVYLFCTHSCVSDTKQVCSLSCPPGTSLWGLLQVEDPQQRQEWLWCVWIVFELKINNSKQQMRVLPCHDYRATDTVLPGVSAGMLREHRDLCPSPWGDAKAHIKLWPTTRTSDLSEKGLLSTSQMLWICNFPPRNLLFIPNKTEVMHGQGTTPQAHTGLPAYSLTHVHPLCSQAKQVAFAHPRGRGSSQPHPSVSTDTRLQPPAPSLPTGLRSQFSLPPSPQLSQRQGLEFGDPPFIPLSLVIHFCPGEWLLSKPLFSLSCLVSLVPVRPPLNLYFQLATHRIGLGKQIVRVNH